MKTVKPVDILLLAQDWSNQHHRYRLEPVQELAEWLMRRYKVDSKAHILQYAMLVRPLLPCTPSIDQNPEQILSGFTVYAISANQ